MIHDLNAPQASRDLFLVDRTIASRRPSGGREVLVAIVKFRGEWVVAVADSAEELLEGSFELSRPFGHVLPAADLYRELLDRLREWRNEPTRARREAGEFLADSRLPEYRRRGAPRTTNAVERTGATAAW